MPPPTVPTSIPGKRTATCRPPSTRCSVPCAHRARADEAEILARRGEDGGDRGRRRERDRLHPRRDGAVRARPREILEIGDGRPQDALDRRVGQRHLGDDRLPVALLEVLERRLLVAAHVRLEDRRARSARAPAASRTPCSARTRCGSSCSRRTASPVVKRQRTWHIGPTTCVFTSRRTAKRESSGMSELARNSRIAGSCSSTQRASVERVVRSTCRQSRMLG